MRRRQYGELVLGRSSLAPRARGRSAAGILFGLALALGCHRPAEIAAPILDPAAQSGPDSCGARSSGGVAMQVLGSGGPIADDARASSGYLVWVDGRARALIDVGGGVFVNFAASGATIEDLELVVLSHLHVDHSVDFAALVKSAYFGERSRPLPVLGPDGSDLFPGLRDYLAALFGEQGAYRYLGWALTPGEGPFVLEPHEIATAGAGEVLERGDVRVEAVGAPHGVVPALGVRIDVDGRSIAFAGDQRLDDPRFLNAITGVDLLIAHHPIPERSGGPVRTLHAPPSAIGAAAASAKVERLVLSHHMIRALSATGEGIAAIREHYRGPLLLAEDLVCVVLP